MTTRTDVFTKISSFCEYGLLSGDELARRRAELAEHGVPVATSFDTRLRTQVPLNCIQKLEGIPVSLFHAAKGGFTVMLEEKITDEGLLKAAVVAKRGVIDARRLEFTRAAPALAGYAEPLAIKAVLEADGEFARAVSEKAHRTALFVLDIDSDGREPEAIDGCQETGRVSIAPQFIQHILISERFRTDLEGINNVIYVPFVMVNFVFCYRDRSDNLQKIPLRDLIAVPNFQAALKRLSDGRSLERQPFFTHMTRI